MCRSPVVLRTDRSDVTRLRVLARRIAIATQSLPLLRTYSWLGVNGSPFATYIEFNPRPPRALPFFRIAPIIMAPSKRQYSDLGNEFSPFNSPQSPYPSSSTRYTQPSSSQGYSHSSSSQHIGRAPKQPRTTHNAQPSRMISGSSQHEPLIIDSDDEDDASQEVPDSTQGYNEEHYSYGLYGMFQNKIVGVRSTTAMQQSERWSFFGVRLKIGTTETQSRF